MEENEEFKGSDSRDTYTEASSEMDYETRRRKERKKCSHFDSILWPCTVVIFLIYSFLTFGWMYSWMIFILASAVSSGFRFAVTKSNARIRKSALSGLVWTSTAFLYLLLSFATFRWDITWILFLLAIPASKIAKAWVFREEDEDETDVKFRKIGTIIWVVILVAIIVFAFVFGGRGYAFHRHNMSSRYSNGYYVSESHGMYNDNGRIRTYSTGPVVYRW